METLKLKSHTVYEHLEELRGKCKKARAHAVRGKPQNTDESDPRRFKSTVRRGLPSLRFGELTTVKVSLLPQSIYRFSTIPTETPHKIF